MSKTCFLPLVVVLLSGAARACDCSPGSLAFQDAFFRYCDEARAAHEEAAPVASMATGVGEIALGAQDQGSGEAGKPAAAPPRPQ